MLLVPLIYLKAGKGVQPVGTNAVWFRQNPQELAQYFSSQGAEALYLNDLNVATTGKGENFSAIQQIQQNLKLKLWVTGNFKSLASIGTYVEIGAEKIVLGSAAYQDPNLLQSAAQKFPQKIAVLIEVKNKHVVVPGMVAPTHKTAQDYASRFEEQGVAALCYADEDLNTVKDFCNHTKVPVLGLSDVQNMQDLEKLFDCEAAGLMGTVLGKPLYENRVDLHGAISFLDDLASAATQETTLGSE